MDRVIPGKSDVVDCAIENLIPLRHLQVQLFQIYTENKLKFTEIRVKILKYLFKRL